MDISNNQINDTIREILNVFIGSTIDTPDEGFELTSKERRDAYEQGMRQM